MVERSYAAARSHHVGPLLADGEVVDRSRRGHLEKPCRPDLGLGGARWPRRRAGPPLPDRGPRAGEVPPRRAVAGQPGLGVGWAHVAHLHPGAPQLSCQGDVDRRERSLGGSVGHHARQRLLGEHGAQVHDEALRGAQQRDEPPQHPERTDDVRQEELLDDDVVGVDERPEGHHTGGVDESVESAMTLQDLGDERVASGAVTEVEPDDDGIGRARFAPGGGRPGRDVLPWRRGVARSAHPTRRRPR